MGIMMEMMVSMMMMGLVGMMVMMMEMMVGMMSEMTIVVMLVVVMMLKVPAPTTMYSQAEVEGKLPSLCFNLTRWTNLHKRDKITSTENHVDSKDIKQIMFGNSTYLAKK